MVWPKNDISVGDIEAMIDKETYPLKSDIDSLKEEVRQLKNHDTMCDTRHQRLEDDHSEYRRKNDDKLAGVYTVLGEIRDIVKQHAPAMKRTTENYTAIDAILRWCGGIGLLAAGAAGIYGAYKFMQGIIL